jgi:uncharacterized membrane protein HdeD (DUF308 family)
MLDILLRSWWVLVLRGLFAILLGLIALIWPDITVFVIITIFGAFLLLDGLIEIWVGFLGRGRDPEWWTDALLGVLAVLAGIAILAWPDVTAVGLMIFLGAMFATYGAMVLYQAIRLRRDLANEWLLAATGAAALLAGIGFMVYPRAGAIVLGRLTGAWLVVLGALLIAVGWKLRGIIRDLEAEARGLREDARLADTRSRINP